MAPPFRWFDQIVDAGWFWYLRHSDVTLLHVIARDVWGNAVTTRRSREAIRARTLAVEATPPAAAPLTRGTFWKSEQALRAFGLIRIIASLTSRRKLVYQLVDPPPRRPAEPYPEALQRLLQETRPFPWGDMYVFYRKQPDRRKPHGKRRTAKLQTEDKEQALLGVAVGSFALASEVEEGLQEGGMMGASVGATREADERMLAGIEQALGPVEVIGVRRLEMGEDGPGVRGGAVENRQGEGNGEEAKASWTR